MRRPPPSAALGCCKMLSLHRAVVAANRHNAWTVGLEAQVHQWATWQILPGSDDTPSCRTFEVPQDPPQLCGLRLSRAAGMRSFSSPPEPQLNGDNQPVDLEELRKVPGYLKGPAGRRVVRALGEEEWEAALDPRTNEPCWRSIKTGMYTVPGVEKPDTWTEVVDKTTGLIYYWNRRTGDTTDLGEPKPGPYGRPKTSSRNVFEAPAAPSMFSQAMEQLAPAKPAADQRGPPEKDISLLELINTPTGYAFVGFSLLALAAPYVQQWLQGPGS